MVSQLGLTKPQIVCQAVYKIWVRQVCLRTQIVCQSVYRVSSVHRLCVNLCTEGVLPELFSVHRSLGNLCTEGVLTGRPEVCQCGHAPYRGRGVVSQFGLTNPQMVWGSVYKKGVCCQQTVCGSVDKDGGPEL